MPPLLRLVVIELFPEGEVPLAGIKEMPLIGILVILFDDFPFNSPSGE